LARDILPAEGSSKPANIRRRVVFPQPFGPTKARREPLGIANEIPENRSTGPKDFEMLLAFIKDMVFPGTY
jgi:hypothetical protein